MTSDWLDRNIWDGVARAIGGFGQLFGIVSRAADERGIDVSVNESVAGAHRAGRLVSRWHAGQVQVYLGAMALGMLALLLLYAWLG